ncbi:hypothetical protein [Stenotrophomonas sp. Y-13]|uniref:hypothetical protein n=1 Tax=Stenotrophomonas sp. Y-13 TaxID=3384161 RepID=UPI003917091F
MKYLGTNKDGHDEYEVPPNPLLAIHQQLRNKEKALADKEDRRHAEAMKLARSSARAAWSAFVVSLLALLVSLAAFCLAQ